MPKKPYDWADGNVPEIGAHSLAKHEILRRYVERYIHVVTKTPGMDVLRLTLVDGFAGGGEYQRAGVSYPGSPLILIDAVRQAEAAVNTARRKPLRVEAHHIFVEKNRVVAAHLRDVLRKRGDSPTAGSLIQVLDGDFEHQLANIVEHVKSRGKAAARSLFSISTATPTCRLQRSHGFSMNCQRPRFF